MDPDDEAAASRFVALRNGRAPQKVERSPKSGAARWVRKLYDEIMVTRANGESWAAIADLLNQAAVQLNGRNWAAIDVRKECHREKKRREKSAGGVRVDQSANEHAPKPAQVAEATSGAVDARATGSPPEAAPGAKDSGVGLRMAETEKRGGVQKAKFGIRIETSEEGELPPLAGRQTDKG